MTVGLSPVAGAGWQFFDSNGVPLAGGRLYTYAAGSTTPETTYTSSTGATANSNPIILNSAGRVSGTTEVWLTITTAYKFVLKTDADVQLWSADDISGIAGVGNPLPVSSGGTGRATATAYAVICGGTTATGSFQSVASVGRRWRFADHADGVRHRHDSFVVGEYWDYSYRLVAVRRHLKHTQS